MLSLSSHHAMSDEQQKKLLDRADSLVDVADVLARTWHSGTEEVRQNSHKRRTTLYADL